MKPVLAHLPPRRRTILFGPTVLGAFLVLGLTLALTTHDPYFTLVLGLPGSVAAAWALLGWPELPPRKGGRPLLSAKAKPWLFFVLAPLFVAVLYFVLGVPLTKVGLPVKWIAVLTLLLAIPLGCALAYWLVGFPKGLHRVRETYDRIPPDRRPWLFYPLSVVFFVVLYIGVGVLTTGALDKVDVDRTLLLNLQPLILLPLCLLLSCLLAYLLVGFPRPTRTPKDVMQKVTGKTRPRLFLATFLLAGIPFTVVIGTLLNAVARTSSNNRAFLPGEVILPLAVVLGYALSLGVAALAWGTPRSWRRYDDYEPGVHPKARPFVILGSGLAVLVAVTVAFGLAGLELFYGLLVGGILGTLLALQLAGLLPRILARRRESTFLPSLPDRVKPLVLFPTWLLLSALLFATLTFAFPDYVAWNFVGSVLLGLAVALFLVEQSLLATLLEERRKERERRRAWKEHRKQTLREATEGPKDA